MNPGPTRAKPGAGRPSRTRKVTPAPACRDPRCPAWWAWAGAAAVRHLLPPGRTGRYFCFSEAHRGSQRRSSRPRAHGPPLWPGAPRKPGFRGEKGQGRGSPRPGTSTPYRSPRDTRHLPSSLAGDAPSPAPGQHRHPRPMGPGDQDSSCGWQSRREGGGGGTHRSSQTPAALGPPSRHLIPLLFRLPPRSPHTSPAGPGLLPSAWQDPHSQAGGGPAAWQARRCRGRRRHGPLLSRLGWPPAPAAVVTARLPRLPDQSQGSVPGSWTGPHARWAAAQPPPSRRPWPCPAAIRVP